MNEFGFEPCDTPVINRGRYSNLSKRQVEAFMASGDKSWVMKDGIKAYTRLYAYVKNNGLADVLRVSRFGNDLYLFRLGE